MLRGPLLDEIDSLTIISSAATRIRYWPDDETAISVKAETIVSDLGFKKIGKLSHQSKWKSGVFQVYKKASINPKWTPILKKECKKFGIDFMTAPYDLKYVSATGLTATLDDNINVDNSPTWTTNAGSLGSILETATGNHFTVAATDADGDTVSYSLQSGSLGGLSLEIGTVGGSNSGVLLTNATRQVNTKVGVDRIVSASFGDKFLLETKTDSNVGSGVTFRNFGEYGNDNIVLNGSDISGSNAGDNILLEAGT